METRRAIKSIAVKYFYIPTAAPFYDFSAALSQKFKACPYLHSSLVIYVINGMMEPEERINCAETKKAIPRVAEWLVGD